MQLLTFVLVTDMAVGVWFANAFQFKQMVVDELENDAKISGGWCGLDVIAKHIYKEVGSKVITMTLIAQEFGFIRI